MWKDLTMSQKADMMDLYLSKGITSLDDMRSLYDSSISDTAQGASFSDGGSIHIKPENRGKFTALKERTGHSATWFKEHGTPAQKKMATFALNSRHWKHGYGGHIYDGTSEDTQQMNIPYAGELPDVTVMPRRIANKAWDKVQERWVGDMPTYYAVNPETGKEEMLREIGNGKYSTYDDKHVFDVLGAEAAKKEREQWIKNGGNASDFDKVMLGTLGLGLTPIALPEIAAGVGTALTNPYVDAGLTSYFGAHGLNHAINEGIDDWGNAAITALELAPLGRLTKPLYEGIVQPGVRLFNSPLTGNWTKIGNREYRLSPNSLGMNRVSVESKPARTVRLYRATGTNGNLEASLDGGQEFAGQWFTDNPTKPQHYASMTVKRAKRAGVDNPVELQYIDIPESELNKYRASEILKGRTDIEYEPTEDFLIPLDYPRQRVPLEGYTGNYLQDARRPLPELDIKSTTPQITAENAANITPEQWTVAQDAAIARGDMAEAQRLRDLHSNIAAKKEGFTIYNTYRSQKPNNKYKWENKSPYDDSRYGIGKSSGYFTTDSEPVARTYKYTDDSPLFNLNVYMKKPYIKDVEGRSWQFADTRIAPNGTKYGVTTDEIVNKVKPEGVYDGVIFKNIVDVGAFRRNLNGASDVATDYVSFPGRAKLRDAVTYDDNGIRIPLGERDNFNINDIRYGLLPFGIGLTGYGLYNSEK